MLRVVPLFVAMVMTLLSCTEAVDPHNKSRILMMGDSMFASNSASGQSVGHVIEKLLEEPVTDRSVMGARIIYRLPISGSAGFSIPQQYREGPWDWVVLNGGGNDLWFGCGCVACNRKLNRLASDGGTGEIQSLIGKLRKAGSKVIYVGYLRSPGFGSPIEHCKDDGDQLEERLKAFAQQDSGVHFVSLADLVPHGDRSFHAFDKIHPSKKGSAAIARRVAQIIKGH